MRILFFITVQKHGGGHSHSLNHISRELGTKHEVLIISVGSGFSRVIGENPYFLNHFTPRGINFLEFFKEIDTTVHNIKPDIIHFFDSVSYNILRLRFSSRKYKIIINKCGGPNIELPFVNNLVVFSQENYEWYRNIPKFRQANIYLIPNRVRQVNLTESYKPVFKDPVFFNFLRICRIGPTYKKGLMDSVNLVNYLRAKGHQNVKLYVIGNIEDENIYMEFMKEISDMKDFIFVITSEQITKDATQMLYLGDAVIGSGRGFMESASVGKPLLTFNAKDNYPILIDEQNFSDAFKTNFSERNVFNSISTVENLNKIERIICDKEYYNQISRFSKSMFQKYFSIEKVYELYSDVYEKAKHGRNRYFQEIIVILKTFYHFSGYTFNNNNK